MMKHPLIPWVLVVVAAAAAVFFALRADRATTRAEKAEAVVREENRLTVVSENMQSGTFVRIEGDNIFIRMPTYTTVDGEQFASEAVNPVRIHSDITVLGVPGSTGRDALTQIPEGADIRFQLGEPEAGITEIYTLVVIP